MRRLMTPNFSLRSVSLVEVSGVGGLLEREWICRSRVMNSSSIWAKSLTSYIMLTFSIFMGVGWLGVIGGGGVYIV